MAAEPGFEPGLRDSKSPVLPLHNSAFYPPKLNLSLYRFSTFGGAEGRTRTDMEVTLQQFLRLPRLPIPPLRLEERQYPQSLFYVKIGDDTRTVQAD